MSFWSFTAAGLKKTFVFQSIRMSVLMEMGIRNPELHAEGQSSKFLVAILGHVKAVFL